MGRIEIIEVKDFKEEYIETIRRFLDLLIFSAPQFTEEDLKAIIESENSHLFFISYQGEIAGMLTLGIYRTPTGVKMWIEDVVVDDRFRGKSFGRQLVEHAIRYAGSLAGSSTLMLTSNPSRMAANKLYRSAGFEPKVTNVYKMDPGKKDKKIP